MTVKCRIGIDDQDEEGPLDRFVAAIADAGCSTVIVHARKAWLKGLSPRENRDVPPLNYERVYRLKRDNPGLTVILNGGIRSLADACAHLGHVDGVMLGRAAYETPFILAEVDQLFYGARGNSRTREDIAAAFLPYVADELSRGTPLHRITRHMLGLFHGQHGGRRFRRILSKERIGRSRCRSARTGSPRQPRHAYTRSCGVGGPAPGRCQTSDLAKNFFP